LTQSGIGTVRMCPAFPMRSTMAQCCSRCCRWEKFSSTASCRLKPHASNTARSARSRLPFSRWVSGHCQRVSPCQPVSQSHSELLDAFHSPDTGGEIRAEETAIGGFVSQPPHGPKT
jgi:hypothetical protein